MREDAYVKAVLRKCDCLSDSGLWVRDKVRYRAWLKNFSQDEQAIGAVLLDNFVYFSDPLTDRLVRGAYAKLVIASLGNLANAVFTRIESEDPRPTDSGNVMCRKLRQEVGIAKARIHEPPKALEAAARGLPIVFVDDFLGSGEQLRSTWMRPYGQDSFDSVYRKQKFPAYYMTLVATQYGLNRVGPSVPVDVVATHIIGSEYSVRSIVNHPLAPRIDNLPDRLHQLLGAYAPKLELKSYMRSQDYSSYGFHSLALAVGFEHSVPDATVPIIWGAADSWTPLARRT